MPLSHQADAQASGARPMRPALVPLRTQVENHEAFSPLVASLKPLRADAGSFAHISKGPVVDAVIVPAANTAAPTPPGPLPVGEQCPWFGGAGSHKSRRLAEPLTRSNRRGHVRSRLLPGWIRATQVADVWRDELHQGHAPHLGLAQDLAPRGIRVNAVAPGPVWTPLQVRDGQPTEKLNSFGDNSWLGRTSQPVEQAPAYAFLASPESSFVVGEVINVNDGANVPSLVGRAVRNRGVRLAGRPTSA